MSNPQPTNWIRPPYAKEESASAKMKNRKKALDAAEERAVNSLAISLSISMKCIRRLCER